MEPSRKLAGPNNPSRRSFDRLSVSPLSIVSQPPLRPLPYSPDLNPIEQAFDQNEDFAAQGRRANHRRDLANHRRPARLLHPERMRKLLQKRRIRYSLTRSRFSVALG